MLIYIEIINIKKIIFCEYLCPKNFKVNSLGLQPIAYYSSKTIERHLLFTSLYFYEHPSRPTLYIFIFNCIPFYLLKHSFEKYFPSEGPFIISWCLLLLRLDQHWNIFFFIYIIVNEMCF